MPARFDRALAAVPLALLLAALPAGAQDNRDPAFNPELPASEAYRETIERSDADRRDRAAEEGESFAPTFNRPTRPLPEAPPAAPPAAAPTPVPVPPREPPAAAPAPPPYAGYAESLATGPAPGETASGHGGPMRALLDALTAPPRIVRLRWPAPEPREPAPEPAASAPAPPPALRGLGPGTGLYARTLVEANSDFPGPVLLEILEPPLAGAVAAGSFAAVGERLTLRLDRLSVRRGGRRLSWRIDGWAVDPACNCFGVSGEVDRHWFARVVLPSAAAFAQGFLRAAATVASTVTENPLTGAVTTRSAAPTTRQQVYAGAAGAADRAAAVLVEGAPDRPTIRIPADTELVLVLASEPAAVPAGARP